MATRFVPNPAFRRELQAGPDFKVGMTVITVRVSEAIKAAEAPFRRTGRYAGQIGPAPASSGLFAVALPRHIAHIVELGSVNNPPEANVRRGVRAAGLRFADTGPKQAD